MEKEQTSVAYGQSENDVALSEQVEIGEQTKVDEQAEIGGQAEVNEQIKADEQAKSKQNIVLVSFKNGIKKFKSPKFSAAYVAKLAILTAISFILYAFVKFSLPFMFPSFLDMQISELPALLAGFSMGPVSGCLVVLFKCLLKFPMSGTAYVGEATDILMGIALVLPASIIYRIKKDKKHALIGLLVGTATFVIAGIIVNRFISIPFYLELYFHGNFAPLLGMVPYKNVTESNFYTYYLLLGVLPFNLMRCIIMSALTFVLYKRLSVLLHWEGTSLRSVKIEGEYRTDSVEETYALAARIADTLDGGETLLLSGDLGAGKTTFTKGLAKALGVLEEITSPTFTILNVYESGRLKLNHLDMYRVESADELAELGVDECFDEDGVTVIEWNKFEKIDGKVIRIDISADGDSRVFNVTSDENNSGENQSDEFKSAEVNSDEDNSDESELSENISKEDAE